MIRSRCLVATALVVVSAAAAAQDRRFEPKSLARYDVSYARCEARFPDMKGHRDDAYLSLWRVKPGAKPAARFAEIRSSAPYKAEKQRASRDAEQTKTPEATKKLERQCRGLWGDFERAPKARP